MIRRYWRRFFAAGGIRTWAHEEVARQCINRRISGDAETWPIEWFVDWLTRNQVEYPFKRALSLGCGEGALERDLMKRGLCREITGVDTSDEALETARRLAERGGWQAIRYRLADLDGLQPEAGAYAAIFAHQSLHHVQALEQCLDAVEASLEPGGLFYLDEYVGPSRSEWSDELLESAQRVYRGLPATVRRRSRLQLPVDWRDPSEAVRSSEIVRTVAERFDILEQRDYGGNLLAVIHPHLALDRLGHRAADDLLLDLLAREDEMLAGGEASFYTVMVARKNQAHGFDSG